MQFLKSNILAEVNADDITFDIHDEFHYNEKTNVDITVKILTGQTQCGFTQYPAELLIEVNENFTREIIEALDKFTVNNNETLIDFGKYTYRQFYSTPTVVGTFQDRGLIRNTAISISVSLISYSNILGLSRILIADVEKNNSVSIKPISFAISYLVDTNSTGSVSDLITRSIGETVATTYSLSIVPTNHPVFCSIIKLMALEGKANAKFNVTMYFNEHDEETKFDISIAAIIQSGNYTHQLTGLPLMQLTFMRGEE